MKQTCRSFHALTVSTEIHTSYATLWSVTYAMEYPTGHSYFLGIHRSLQAFRHEDTNERVGIGGGFLISLEQSAISSS